jgi:O-antigen/teichoic acid export membrane protein
MEELFPTIVYLLCFVTSSACAFLLGRSYGKTGARLLLWSSLCFFFLAINNLLLVVDLVFLPEDVDLRFARLVAALIAVCVLLFGFVWDLEED